MKKILSLLLTSALMLSLLLPTAVYSAESTALDVLYENDMESYDEGTTGDAVSASGAYGLVIPEADTGTDQVSITTDTIQGKVLKYGPDATSENGGFSFLSAPLVDDNPIISFKFKPVATGSDKSVYPGYIDFFSSAQNKICRLRLRWGSNGGTALSRNLFFRSYFSDKTSGTEHLVAENFSDGTPGWLDVKLVFDHSKKTYDIYVDGKQIATEEKYYDSSTVHTDITRIMFYSDGGVHGYFLIDDLKISKTVPTELKSSMPANGAEKVDPTDILTLAYNKENLVAASAVLTITPENGEAVIIDDAAVSTDTDDPKKLHFDLSVSKSGFEIDYGKTYEVSVSGVKDAEGNDVKTAKFSFTTREAMLIVGEPEFTFNNTTGKMDGSVIVTNERKDSSPDSTVIFAAFDNDEMKDVALQTKPVDKAQAATFTQSLAYNASYTYKAFAWNSLSGMEPLGVIPVSQILTDVMTTLDYISGFSRIRGTLTEGSKATIMVLKPEVSIENIPSEGNVSDYIAYIGEEDCDSDGSFTAEFTLKLPQTDAGKEITLLTGGKGIAVPSSKLVTYFDTQTTQAVLAAIKNAASGDVIVKLLDGSNLINIAENVKIKANDVLSLTVGADSDYTKLKDKAAACDGLIGKTFAGLEAVWSAFDAAVATQKAYEAEVDAALVILNDITWDKMEEKLAEYAELLVLNMTTGSYANLTTSEKTTLYKNLANSYTFTFGADLDRYIESKSLEIINERGSGDGGSGSSGSSGGRVNTKMELSGISIAPDVPVTTTPSFTDLGSAIWAKESIEYLAARNIINGMGGNIFAPNDSLTREQMVKIMVLAGEITLDTESVSFSDVDENAWFRPYIAAAFNNGLVAGMGDGSFGSGRNVIRQDLAVFLVRLAKVMGKSLPSSETGEVYTDNNDISDYAHSAVYTLRNAGIMSGEGNGSFAPNGNITRAMAAKAVYELLQYGE